MLFLFIIASGDVREQIEEPDPCSMLRIGREPWNLGTPCLKKYIKYCIFLLNFLLIPHPLRRCKRTNRRTRPLLNASHWQGTPEPWHSVLEKIYYLFFSALAASIILFAWSCGTSSYLTKSIWKEPLACVIALRSIAYLNISE